MICNKCEVQHLLVIQWNHVECVIYYNRFTGRYAPEEYDEPLDVPLVKFKSNKLAASKGSTTVPVDSDICYSDPIIVVKRKKHFSKSEVEAIWRKTGGLCHLCRRKRWKVNQRGPKGWHIDHVIPNAGGGDTELMVNFLVACAPCNLRKGGGPKCKAITKALEDQILKPLGL